MLHTKFVEIGPPVLEKIFFKVFFTIYGRDGHLSHVTKMPRTNFGYPTHRSITQNLALIGQAVSGKIFEIVEQNAQNAGAWIFYNLTYEPLAQVS